MLFFIYCRKSVNTAKGESIENQKNMCRQYIFSRFGMQNNIKVYTDEGFSGKDTHRPMFKKMIEDIDFEGPDYIVCYRLDRISRNVGDFSSLIERLNRKKISLVCLKEEFDTSKPIGKAMMYIASVFSQLERETIAERVRDNMLELSKSGRWLGGTTPLGFKSVSDTITENGKTKTFFKLAPVKHEENIVKYIFSQYINIKSLCGVKRQLDNLNIKTRNGKNFSPTAIKSILLNPVYCQSDQYAINFLEKSGCLVFAEKSNENGLTAYNKRSLYTNKTLKSDWIIATGKHRAFINGKDWVRVQKIIESNAHKTIKPALLHNKNSLLSGIIYCKNCGSRLFAKQRSGKDVYDYICANKQKYGKAFCNMQNLDGIDTDRKFNEKFSYIMFEEFLSLDTTNKRRLIESVCKRIEWDGKDLHINFI